jgi:hypothetical protein
VGGVLVGTPDDVWKYHPKHVEQFPDINKLCNVASCWIYIGIILGAHCIIHISRIRVNTSYISRTLRTVEKSRKI